MSKTVYGCSSLINAPDLLSETLVNSCYKYMFQGCKNLMSINVNFKAWGDESTTLKWMDEVTSTGTFTKFANLSGTKNDSHIPSSFTISNKTA